MKKTIDPTLPEAPLPERLPDIVRFLNREAIPLLKALRDAANYTGTERLTVTTAGDGTYSRLWTSPALVTDCTWTVRASVAGTASAAGGSQHSGHLICATFQSIAGTVTQTGATTVLYAHESDAAIDVRFNIDSPNRQAYLEARDAGAAAMAFVAVVETTEATL